ncbi:unnamed protein product [Orchesella dallaii]|uniref:Uncharacterized protein n=1 Tax=Orchesella dallaii TaxID=48710 RepID=A0ABP1R356_9HEXA
MESSNLQPISRGLNIVEKTFNILSLLDLAGVVKSTTSHFGIPDYTIFLTKHVIQPNFLETGNDPNINDIEQPLQKLSSPILFYTNSKKVSLVCLTCVFKQQTNSPQNVLFPIPHKLTKASIKKHWKKLSLNFHNTKEDPVLSSRLRLCESLNLSMEIVDIEADKWDYRCLFLFLRNRYNHTMLQDGFMGSWSHYFEKIGIELAKDNLQGISQLPLIVGQSLKSKGFIYRIVLRSHSSKGVNSNEAITTLFSLNLWPVFLVFFVIFYIILYFAGMRSRLTWLIAELLEKGFRIRRLSSVVKFIIILWSFYSFFLRQMYCSTMYSILTKVSPPKVPSSLEELAFQSKIPLLTHTYDFLMPDFKMNENMSSSSNRYLRKYQPVMFVINDVINSVSSILKNKPLKNVSRNKVSLSAWQVPPDFAVLLYEEDMRVFTMLISALDALNEEQESKVVMNSLPHTFPRFRAWIMPNSFVAVYATREIAYLFESGIYQRMHQVKDSNRIISRFTSNLKMIGSEMVTHQGKENAAISKSNDSNSTEVDENILQKTSSKILLYETESEILSILCLTCVLKRPPDKQIFQSVIHNGQNNFAKSVASEWKRINTNFHNTKHSKSLSHQLKLCDELHLSEYLKEADADLWDARCLWLFLHKKYNHTLSLQRFMGMAHLYLATLYTTIPQNSSVLIHDDFKRISGHGLVAKGFIYRIIIRSQQAPSVSYSALLGVLDTNSGIVSIGIFFLIMLILYLRGMKSSLFWLFAELVEKGIRPKMLNKTTIIPITLWMFGTFFFRQLYSSGMYSNLTKVPLPKVPQNLNQLASNSRIPLLTHSYDFLMLNYTLTQEVSPGSLKIVNNFRMVLNRVRELLNRASSIAHNVPLRDSVEKNGTQLFYYKVPPNFAVLFLSDDMPIFYHIFSAFASMHRKSIQIMGNNCPLVFPRLKSWTMPNCFIADSVLKDTARFYESGIYDRLLLVRKANRIITRFNKNEKILDKIATKRWHHEHQQAGEFKHELSEEETSPRWASFIFSQQDQHSHHHSSQSQKDEFHSFSVTSLQLVWIVYAVCITAAVVILMVECVAWRIAKERKRREQKRLWKATFDYRYVD